MQRVRDTVIHRFGRRRSLRYWAAAADRADTVGLQRLAEEAALARRLRTRLDAYLAAAERRLGSRPAPDRSGATPGIGADVAAEWSWSPDAWTVPLSPSGLAGPETGAAFGAGVKIFHDSAAREIVLRQRRAPAGRRTRFEAVVETYRFDGGFLSLAVSLPPEGREVLGPGHVLGLGLRIAAERPLECYARLNLRSGPNTATAVVDLVPGPEGAAGAEFDLAHVAFDPLRLEAAWIDVILDATELSAVALGELTVFRRPRAAF